MDRTESAKDAAVRLWSDAPSYRGAIEAEPGTQAHVERLLATSRAYAPWIDDALGLGGAAGMDILDLGCGPGADLVRMALAGGRVTGVDLVPEHVERARANLAAMGLSGAAEVGDAEALRFEDKSFDRVVSNNALQFTPHLERSLREAHRVLRHGGDARVVLYHRDSLYYWGHFVLTEALWRREWFRTRSMAAVLSRAIPWSTSKSTLSVRVVSRRELRRLIEDAGFQVNRICVRGLSPSHFLPLALLADHVSALRNPRLHERLGSMLGWYVFAEATRR
jgi:ubiquinone/menaquinone biosynthesis C-methylase UbiE